MIHPVIPNARGHDSAGVTWCGRPCSPGSEIVKGRPAGRPGTLCARAQVRSAVFDMLAAAGGRAGALPGGTRWLDLFAGTGSVGLEALSRGAGHCRFIELDHWVVSNVRCPPALRTPCRRCCSQLCPTLLGMCMCIPARPGQDPARCPAFACTG